MTNKEFDKVMQELIFPVNFIKNGRLSYYFINKDDFRILVGYYLDKSSHKNFFYLQFFVQCLYVPFVSFDFSLGYRIGDYWKKTDINIINDEIKRHSKIINTLNSFDSFLNFINSNPYFGNEVGKIQNISYTYLSLNEYEKSTIQLDKIIELKNSINPEWFTNEINDAEILKSFITNYDYKSINKKLLEWQFLTMNNLNLPTNGYAE